MGAGIYEKNISTVSYCFFIPELQTYADDVPKMAIGFNAEQYAAMAGQVDFAYSDTVTNLICWLVRSWQV